MTISELGGLEAMCNGSDTSSIRELTVKQCRAAVFHLKGEYASRLFLCSP